MSFASDNGLGSLVAGGLEIPLLVPVFPRKESDGTSCTQALDRDTIEIQHGSLYRLDIQWLKLIDDARARMRAQGTAVPGEFLMRGFSASGIFSNRFAFLHPERLPAVASGAVNALPPRIFTDALDDNEAAKLPDAYPDAERWSWRD